MSSLRGRQSRIQPQPAGIAYQSAGNEAARFRMARLAADALIARREAQRAHNYDVLDNCVTWARIRQQLRQERAS